MSLRDSITLHRSLTRPVPSGNPISNTVLIRRLVLPAEAEEARELLNEAYAQGQGSVLSTEAWLAALLPDVEYDPDLCLGAFDRDAGGMIGLIQAWNTGFIKDLGVNQSWLRRGVGRALLMEICTRLQAMGAKEVSLKVVADNRRALRFYDGLGFTRLSD